MPTGYVLRVSDLSLSHIQCAFAYVINFLSAGNETFEGLFDYDPNVISQICYSLCYNRVVCSPGPNAALLANNQLDMFYPYQLVQKSMLFAKYIILHDD